MRHRSQERRKEDIYIIHHDKSLRKMYLFFFLCLPKKSRNDFDSAENKSDCQFKVASFEPWGVWV